ncbi:MAG: hypothetical protein ACJAWV_003535 [Flammeovirgaceae bacterium]|jgi:hypothetical protein
MQNKLPLFIFFLVGFSNIHLSAQELNFTVKINADQVQTQERQVFAEMETAIQAFLNNTKWTDDDFKENERIKCDILITLNKGTSITNFGAIAQIKSLRPIYGTDYESPVLNFFDKNFTFTYAPSQPLIFAENSYSTELTSLLAYYAYLVIAMDYDTFSEKGGQSYYERALNIMNNAQTNGGQGWNGIGGDVRDRYWLVTNLRNPQFEPYRLSLYNYHRKALDFLTEKPEEARKIALESLQKIKIVRNQQATSVTLNSFFDAKSMELTNLFLQADQDTRTKASELLIQLDPTNAGIYRKLVK